MLALPAARCARAEREALLLLRALADERAFVSARSNAGLAAMDAPDEIDGLKTCLSRPGAHAGEVSFWTSRAADDALKSLDGCIGLPGAPSATPKGVGVEGSLSAPSKIAVCSHCRSWAMAWAVLLATPSSSVEGLGTGRRRFSGEAGSPRTGFSAVASAEEPATAHLASTASSGSTDAGPMPGAERTRGWTHAHGVGPAPLLVSVTVVPGQQNLWRPRDGQRLKSGTSKWARSTSV